MPEGPMTKAELLADIEREWATLQAELSRLTPEQLTELRNRDGWSAKDHLNNLTAWERSAVYFLQGKPRHEGVGVEQALYEADDVDAINAAVQQQTRDLSLPDSLAQSRAVHAQLLALLGPLDDADLHKRYRDYLPDEPGDGDGPPAYSVISGNTAEHYREHLQWIKQMMNDE